MARAKDVRPYVERALGDQEARDHATKAFEAARDVYMELMGRRGVTGVAARVATDKDIQENLKTAAEELREAAARVQGKQSHTMRNMMLFLGMIVGVLFNPLTGSGTRGWIRSKIFGETDDYSYTDGTSTNQYAPPPPPPSASSTGTEATGSTGMSSGGTGTTGTTDPSI